VEESPVESLATFLSAGKIGGLQREEEKKQQAVFYSPISPPMPHNATSR